LHLIPQTNLIQGEQIPQSLQNGKKKLLKRTPRFF